MLKIRESRLGLGWTFRLPPIKQRWDLAKFRSRQCSKTAEDGVLVHTTKSVHTRLSARWVTRERRDPGFGAERVTSKGSGRIPAMPSH